MAEKSQNADSGKEIKEKKINTKEKTTQQQKGLPTLSADLKTRLILPRFARGSQTVDIALYIGMSCDMSCSLGVTTIVTTSMYILPILLIYLLTKGLICPCREK